MVATNEFEDAWMDEGINSYTEVKVLDSIFGKKTSIINMGGATLGERRRTTPQLYRVADLDPMAQNAYNYYSFNSYGGDHLWQDRQRSAHAGKHHRRRHHAARRMHTYFMKYRFTHPTKEDFLKTIEEVSGKDLRWYFNQAVYGITGVGLRSPQSRFLPDELVPERKEKQREAQGETE